MTASVTTTNERIAHLTTAHPRNDIRVRLKECEGLAAAGHEVHLLVADGLGPEVGARLQVHDIGVVPSRWRRMLMQPWRMWRAARGLQARVYHFHDPELIPVALLLRWGGAEVIYDSHEDVPRAILSKHWIHPWLRSAVASAFEALENFAARHFSAVVAATPHIARRFRRLNGRSIDVNNFPMASELEQPVERRGDGRTACYIGGITPIRGAVEMVRAMEHVDGRLIMAGPVDRESTLQAMRACPGWNKVDYRGKVSRAEVREIMAESELGLLLFHPEPNHVDAQPNKMFEYMSAGLPVLASDFPLWREILVPSGAGVCVDPMDPAAIGASMRTLLADPQAARVMGGRGRDAVLNGFRWEAQLDKLLRLYKGLMA